MRSSKKFWAAVVLSGLILITASGVIAAARTQPTQQGLNPQQREIVREGRLAEYIAANYGGRGEITIEQADAFCHHLSVEFNIPYVYFTQGGCDPLNETI